MYFGALSNRVVEPQTLSRKVYHHATCTRAVTRWHPLNAHQAVSRPSLAATVFNRKQTVHFQNSRLVSFENTTVTSAPFAVVRRPPVSRRQLHLLQFSKGGQRRKYGGTVTAHGFRKGDCVEATRAGKTYRGWVSGDTTTQVSVSDINWKRIAQFSARKVRLLKRSTGLIVKR
ncbi:hypothetical protein [Zarconia navalis]|uniref:hypothetical protein n=1 Tax=Zarconia navalis TaxID=2992134 RepID=UPI0029C63CF6|nr:hypothetical protein [Zarconia navalis]